VRRFLEKHQEKVKRAEKIKEKFLYNGKLAQKMWNWKFKYK